jgi:hypothetical protein
MLNIWTQPSGYTLPGVSGLTGNLELDTAKTTFDSRSTTFDSGTFQERVIVNIPLPTTGDLTNVTFKIISGSLPPGLRLDGAVIVGNPYNVPRTTKYLFCIRAQLNHTVADRTFNMIVNGGQLPTFITPSGLLPVGLHGQKYTLGKSPVNYQLSAVDPDGLELTYFINSEDGKLPPGVTLSPSGKITGIVEPVASIDVIKTGDGTYDNSFYDNSFYDFGLRSTNGYDSFVFDTVDFDYSLPVKTPKSLNQTYEFLVSVSTGSVITKRKFAIFVIGEESFHADYTQITDDTELFTADVTFLKEPIWLTDGNLGACRADNYVTFALECINVVDNYPIVFTIDNVNNLPPGLTFNPVDSTVYLAGRIPFQPSIAKSYTFTITASRIGEDIQPAVSIRTFTLRVIGDIDNTIYWKSSYNIGSIPANFVSDLQVSAFCSTDSNLIYTKTSGDLPPGLVLASDGEITGKVNQYGTANIIRFTTVDNGAFTLDQKGTSLWPKPSVPAWWQLPGNFGYAWQSVSGLTGDIPIKVNTTIDGSHQYDIIGKRGLILFDSQNTNFSIDGATTTFDRNYKFTVKVEDQFGLTSSTKDFTITVTTPNQKLYSNIRTQPLLDQTQRSVWKKFITSTDIFTTSSIFRPSDPNFGVQKDLSMLIYSGIESKDAAKFLGAMGLNNKRKRFRFGDLKKAVAINNGVTLYEVIYLEIIDPAEPNSIAPSQYITNNVRDQLKLTSDISGAIWTSPATAEGITAMKLSESWLDRPINEVTIDSTGYNISDDAPKKHYINSISNWRNNLASVGDTERNYLPLWMRSIQPGQKQQLGFKLAVPLCYCKPGTADDIMINIKYSGFDFKLLDYTSDRYIIDAVAGYSSDKYLVFKNHSTIV